MVLYYQYPIFVLKNVDAILALEGILMKIHEIISALACLLQWRPQSGEGDEIGSRPPPKTLRESRKSPGGPGPNTKLAQPLR